MIKLERRDNFYPERNSTIMHYPTNGSDASVEPKYQPKISPLDEKPIYADEKPIFSDEKLPLYVDNTFGPTADNYNLFRPSYRNTLPYFSSPPNRQYCMPLPQGAAVKSEQYQLPLSQAMSSMTIKQQQEQFHHPLGQTMAVKQQSPTHPQTHTQSQQQQTQQLQHSSPSVSTTVHSSAIDTVPYTTTAMPTPSSESKSKSVAESTSAPDTTKKSGTRRPEKPPVSYINMIAQAIRESPDKRLTLNEIYVKLRSKWVQFRATISKWFMSIFRYHKVHPMRIAFPFVLCKQLMRSITIE